MAGIFTILYALVMMAVIVGVIGAMATTGKLNKVYIFTTVVYLALRAYHKNLVQYSDMWQNIQKLINAIQYNGLPRCVFGINIKSKQVFKDNHVTK